MYRNGRPLPGEELRHEQAAQGNSDISGIQSQNLAVDDVQDIRFQMVDFADIRLQCGDASVEILFKIDDPVVLNRPVFDLPGDGIVGQVGGGIDDAGSGQILKDIAVFAPQCKEGNGQKTDNKNQIKTKLFQLSSHSSPLPDSLCEGI